MYSMLYTVNLGLCDYVPFSQIQSHMHMYSTALIAIYILIKPFELMNTNFRLVLKYYDRGKVSIFILA